MPNYVISVLIAFLEPVLHAWSNILDNYFSNTLFPNLAVLLFFGTLLNVVFLPLVLFFDPFVGVPLSLLWILAIIAVVNVAYAFPYYWALRHADTSVVASLFSLGKIFVPLLAFLIVGEVLLLPQYIGFGLIILSSALLTLDLRKLKINKAFFLMLLVSFVLSFQTILYKYVFEAGVNWGSVVATLTLMELIIAAGIMFALMRPRAILDDLRTIRTNWKLFVTQQGLEWGGNVSASYAVSALPVTVAQSIVGTQPLFVLVYALLFGKKLGHVFKEQTARGDLAKKGVLFALTIIGTVLVVAYGSNFAI